MKKDHNHPRVNKKKLFMIDFILVGLVALLALINYSLKSSHPQLFQIGVLIIIIIMLPLGVYRHWVANPKKPGEKSSIFGSDVGPPQRPALQSP